MMTDSSFTPSQFFCWDEGQEVLQRPQDRREPPIQPTAGQFFSEQDLEASFCLLEMLMQKGQPDPSTIISTTPCYRPATPLYNDYPCFALVNDVVAPASPFLSKTPQSPPFMLFDLPPSEQKGSPFTPISKLQIVPSPMDCMLSPSLSCDDDDLLVVQPKKARNEQERSGGGNWTTAAAFSAPPHVILEPAPDNPKATKPKKQAKPGVLSSEKAQEILVRLKRIVKSFEAPPPSAPELRRIAKEVGCSQQQVLRKFFSIRHNARKRPSHYKKLLAASPPSSSSTTIGDDGSGGAVIIMEDQQLEEEEEEDLETAAPPTKATGKRERRPRKSQHNRTTKMDRQTGISHPSSSSPLMVKPPTSNDMIREVAQQFGLKEEDVLKIRDRLLSSCGPPNTPPPLAQQDPSCSSPSHFMPLETTTIKPDHGDNVVGDGYWAGLVVDDDDDEGEGVMEMADDLEEEEDLMAMTMRSY